MVHEIMKKHKIFGVIAVLLVVVLLFAFVGAQASLSDSKSIVGQDAPEKEATTLGTSVDKEPSLEKSVPKVESPEIRETSYSSAVNSGVSLKEVENDRESYFRNELGIAVDRETKETVVPKLIERELEDEENAKQIIRVAKLVKEENRETISKDLLEFDKSFMTRLDWFASQGGDVKSQVENYIELKKSGLTAELVINDEKISELFESGDLDSFMNSLL